MNTGELKLSAGHVILTRIYVILDTGGILSAGTLELLDSTTIGTGTLNANVVSNSHVGPTDIYTHDGVDAGRIDVVGDYTQTRNGYLATTVFGTAPGTGFGQLRVQGTVTLDGGLSAASTMAAPGPPVGTELVILDNDGVDPVIGRFNEPPDGTLLVLNSVPYEVRYTAGDGNDVALVRVPNRVTRRQTYYDNSVWYNTFLDLTGEAAVAIEFALAIDKSPLLPGGTATFANYTSYDKGINGIVVDIANLPTGTATASDFVFKTGNNNSVGMWTPLDVTPTVTVRLEGGTRGSDRVRLTWPDGTIKNTWLQVTVLPTANTGIASADVFYFGNAVGETGDAPDNALVNATDEILARGAQRNILNPAPLDFRFDFNRDKLVNATDQIAARTNATNLITALRLIAPPATPGGGPPAAAALPEAGALADAALVGDGESGDLLLLKKRR